VKLSEQTKPRGKHVAIVYQQSHVTNLHSRGRPISVECPVVNIFSVNCYNVYFALSLQVRRRIEIVCLIR